MHTKKIIRPELFFNGNINDKVNVDQLIWRETEQISDSYILEYLFHNSNYQCDQNTQIYFFSAMLFDYPINFKLKHFGFWKSCAEKYKITFKHSAEQIVDLNGGGAFFGCCCTKCTREVVNMLMKNSIYSWILISKNKYNLELINEKFVNITSNQFGVLFEDVINFFCYKNDKIVVLIDGSGESSLNLFYKNI